MFTDGANLVEEGRPLAPGGTLDLVARLFSVPNPVNEKAARTVAAGVAALVVATLLSRALWLTIPLAYGFVARVASGPRFSPLGQLASRVVAPRLGAPRLVPGPPKRFAQSMGALFSLAALGCWLAGERTAAFAVLAVLLLPALAEAVLAYCVGCEIFALGMRLGVVPATLCEECLDITRHPPSPARSSA